MAAHLSYGRVNLNILREAARKELREFLDKCAGSKVTDTRKYEKHDRIVLQLGTSFAQCCSIVGLSQWSTN